MLPLRINFFYSHGSIFVFLSSYRLPFIILVWFPMSLSECSWWCLSYQLTSWSLSCFASYLYAFDKGLQCVRLRFRVEKIDTIFCYQSVIKITSNILKFNGYSVIVFGLLSLQSTLIVSKKYLTPQTFYIIIDSLEHPNWWVVFKIKVDSDWSFIIYDCCL